ncbi:MAG: type II and III secretion system protein family protein [Gammaproteobacteria bacterium]
MNKLGIKATRLISTFAAVVMLAAPWIANGASHQPILRAGSDQQMVVPLYKSAIMRLDEPATRVSVGSPDVADILILRANQLYVLGKDLGSTNVTLWDRNDRLIGTVSVEVTHDLESLKSKLHQLLPGDEIEVHSAQKSIILSGRVASATAMTAAIQIAEGYLASANTAVENVEFKQDEKVEGQVINLLQVGGGQQVMLEIKVAEIERTELRSMEAAFQAFGATGNWNLGGGNNPAGAGALGLVGDSFNPLFPDVTSGFPVTGTPWTTPTAGALTAPVVGGDQALFASFTSADFIFNMALNVAKNKGMAKILAEPTLTTLTGEQASFLSGGEFPFPVDNGNNNGTTVEFKKFGVEVVFTPYVLGNGIINLETAVSVSEPNDNASLAINVDDASSFFAVPSLRVRQASASYELRDGQTIAMAGLIDESVRQTVTKFPGLGDIPILGALFRSQAYIKGETELMIVVTPRLAKPISQEDLRLPTDSFVEPSDADFYLWGKMEGSARRSDDDDDEAAADEGGTDGDYGQQIN